MDYSILSVVELKKELTRLLVPGRSKLTHKAQMVKALIAIFAVPVPVPVQILDHPNVNIEVAGKFYILRDIFLRQDPADSLKNILINKQISYIIKSETFWADKGKIDFGIDGLSYNGYRFNWAKTYAEGRIIAATKPGGKVFKNIRIESGEYTGKSNYTASGPGGPTRTFEYNLTIVDTDFWGIASMKSRIDNLGSVSITTSQEFKRKIERMPTNQEVLSAKFVYPTSIIVNSIATPNGIVCGGVQTPWQKELIGLLGQKIFDTLPSEVALGHCIAKKYWSVALLTYRPASNPVVIFANGETRELSRLEYAKDQSKLVADDGYGAIRFLHDFSR